MSGLQLFGVVGVHGAAAVPPDTEVVGFRDIGAVVGPVEALDEALVNYRRVVECVFRRQAMLPAPPGTVFRDESVVLHWLELHYFTLLDALGFVEERAVARVVVQHRGANAGAGLLDEGTETVVQDALRVLRRHAVASVMVATEGAGHHSSTSFLVEQDRWEHFEALVAEENARLSDAALALSGPWPPYDFVRMQFTN